MTIADDDTLSDFPSARFVRANAIVARNAQWALGMRMLPVPIAGLVGMAAIQVKMLKELSDLYEVPYVEDAAKKVLGVMISALGSIGLGTSIAAGIIHFFPIVGPGLGAMALQLTTGAFTFATGRIFTMHFELGGSFLDLDPEKMRAHFQKELENTRGRGSMI
ncbi:YcjF family protein [Polyangium aurulentum]|uniref:YcjF family protein n=1 Tax=Polyangium aurulentum TaxID=2567896 RepID=UPI0010ADB090|nr:DUF697 domain-containing protein [Polyangium aurulentum]UQA57494.1 DUF697 domain-containing protein [Polyangium aurulentum]